MTHIKNPYIDKDKLPTDILLHTGKRLDAIWEEVSQILDAVAIDTNCQVFSEDVRELRESIINELGCRSLRGDP